MLAIVHNVHDPYVKVHGSCSLETLAASLSWCPSRGVEVVSYICLAHVSQEDFVSKPSASLHSTTDFSHS